MPAISASIRRRLCLRPSQRLRSAAVLSQRCRPLLCARSCKVWLYTHARACCKTGAGYVYARRSISVLQRHCRNAANRYFVRRSCKVWLYMHARACCKTGAGGTHARRSVSVLQRYCRNAASRCIPYHLLKKSPPQIYFTAAIKNRNFLL